jgi:hypothetical protein
MSSLPARVRGRRGLAVWVVGVAVAIAVVVLAVTLWPRPPTAAEPFRSDSPWRTPIAADAAVDAGSAPVVSRITRDGMMHAGLVEFGIPIYSATADTRRYTVPCAVDRDWGPCPFADVTVPIPDGATPHTGSDGAMVVVDEDSRAIYEFWQAVERDDGWSASFGAINYLDGTGWGGAATGSGASRLGGVIRVAEVEAGVIEHALAVQTDSVCRTAFRAPAIKTDGAYGGRDCVPEGARLRLDPTLDLDTLPLSPAERTVAVALQQYGAYVVDVGGAPLSVSFERAADATPTQIGSVYTDAGLRWDYDGMEHIPWNRLQVLA